MGTNKFTVRFFNNNPVNPYAVIIYVSFILFLLRIYACQYVLPEFTGMDYYGYVELGKNIFHRLDFTVNWELDSPIQYPPFFPILIYLLTCLTKNAVASILWINIFSASFYLVPLFSLVRNMLNTYFAVLAVVFATYYFGIKPCYLLNMDFFYSFLVIIICWFVWDTLTHRSRQAWRYVLAGILISLADLTKYSGSLFCLASVVSILYYFARHQHSIKTGLKFSALLFLGAAPLFMTYHLLLYNNSPRGTPTIATHVFFDGNYMYENGLSYRIERISELNSAGTEFRHVSLVKTNNIFNFSLKEPLFVFDKYMWGLNKITQEMTFSVLPGGTIAKSKFYNLRQDGGELVSALIGDYYTGPLRETSATEVRLNPDNYLKENVIRKAVGSDFDKVWDILQQSQSFRMGVNVIFQGAFFVLLMLSGTYFKWHFKIIHIMLFAVGMVLIPLASHEERYLMPFMPLYFVLWLFILNAGYCHIQTVTTNKIILRYLALVVFALLVSVYSANAWKQIEQRHMYFKDEVKRNHTWLQTASWIKNDSMRLPKRAKIMSCHNNYLSYLTDSGYIRLPYVIANWDKVINFAALKKVNYIVIDGDYLNSFLTFSEDEFRKPLVPEVLLRAIKTGSVRMNGRNDNDRRAALQMPWGSVKKKPEFVTGIIDKMVVLLNDRNSNVRQAALQTLRIMAEKKPRLARDIMYKWLDDPSSNYRQAALQTLGIMAEEGSGWFKGIMDKFLELTEDRNSNVRQAAVQTLVIIADKKPELLQADQGIIDKLGALMDDKDSNVRRTAVQAMGIMAEKKPELLSPKWLKGKAALPAAVTPLESLNQLLAYQDLYLSMPKRPVGSINFIHQLEQGGHLNLLALRYLNRLLIEANYPKEAPHELFDAHTGSLRVTTVHEIKGEYNTVWVLRI